VPAMPKSKHRRKRPKTHPHQPSPESLAVTPADTDSDFAAALAQAEAELAAEIAATDEDGEPGHFLDGSESDEEFDRVARSLIEAVEAQLSANDPPEVAAALARLLAAGHDRDRAIAMIGTVMMIEMNEVMRNERPFDRALYANRLAALPELPAFD
jgi:hypothetical protein